ncbi:MAG: DUF3443 family protein [Paraburkholderia sp.]|uniref:DUF3443 family protein n=1 Tax=Burkholderiaceae TaxID=119060 RepID=UPI0010F47E6A|nr:DUF3443 family protein [Burkholderia sp. 4M9327F10]
MRQIAWIIAATLGLSMAACGGGGGGSDAPASTAVSATPASSTTSSTGSSTTTNTNGTNSSTSSTNVLAADATAVPTTAGLTNTLAVSVSGTGIHNQPMVSVTICGSNTGASGNCTTIPNAIVDTGSYGLRLFRSVIPDATFNTLAAVPDSSNQTLAECAGFTSAYGWGTVHLADIKLSGETATAVPIHVLQDPSLTTAVPNTCKSGTALTTPAALGGNGIMGIGVNLQDCGTPCALGLVSGVYYTNAGAVTTVPVNQQVANPAAMLAQDNNGVILEMAQVADSGSATGSGTLVFGIDTQSNNTLSGAGATLFPNAAGGNFTAAYNGTTYTNEAYFDSGSTALFLQDTSIPHDGSSLLYIPTTTQGRTATLNASGSSTVTLGFNIANGNTLSTSGNNAFNDLGVYATGALDFGLPAFYGRHVYYGFQGRTSTGGGTGPYVAYVSN